MTSRMREICTSGSVGAEGAVSRPLATRRNAKRSRVERRRFFETSRASIAEVAACIDLARVFGIMPSARAASYNMRCERINRMLWGMMK